MKTLILLRHAKSDWNDPALRDFDRPLNARGEKAARAMGREMKRLGLGFDHILASAAARVTETLAGLAETLGALSPVYDERIYLAAPASLLEIVREADNAHASLLLAGHNPGMEMLALALGREGPLHDEIAEKYPTGALTEIAFEAERWQDIQEGAGTIHRFIRPRDLDPALGPGH